MNVQSTIQSASIQSASIQSASASQPLQVQIPPAIAQALRLRPGQDLQWSIDATGQILLRCLEPSPTPTTPPPQTPPPQTPPPQKGARHC